MTSQAAFHKNLATAKKKIGAVNGVQSILNYYGGVAYISEATKL